MTMINRHIEYLISRHDCVIVPGWGAFIAQYEPARIDADNGLIVPPCRVLSFNQSISHNDGLLVSSIVRREKMSYEAAQEAVKDHIEMMHMQLDNAGEVALARLGVFSKKGNNIIFTSPDNYISSSQYLGLPVVNTRRIDEETIIEEKPRRKDVIYVPVSRNIFKVAASLLLLIGLGITLSTPIMVDDSANYAAISAPKVTAPVKVKPIIAEPAHNAELFIAIPDATTATATVDTTATKALPQLNINNLHCDDTDSYCLIVASLASRELAEEYIAEHGDTSMHILEANGKFRIYIATGATATQALAPTHDATFASRYPAAWVCRR